MQGGFEAAGDLATGGLIGRALEPEAGETAAHGAHAHGNCLNCQTPLQGEFCHTCGQAAHIHKTLMSIVHDVLHGVFHFEGKIYRTIPMLFWKPGSLTRRYIDGERVRFVSPLALFLFSVFLMVATFETIGGPIGNNSSSEKAGVKLTPAALTEELKQKQAEATKLEGERKALQRTADRTAAIDDRIDKLGDRIDKLAEDIGGLKSAKSITEGKLPGSEVKGAVDVDLPEANGTINTGIPSLDQRIKYALKEPKLFFYKLQSNAYKFSWALVPISLPFIWILFFWRRDVGPYDHAIFAIYSLSAMTLGVIGLTILNAIGIHPRVIATIFALGPPLHMYKQLRGTYRIGRFGALWRTFVLINSAAIAGTLFFIVILGVAA